MNNGEQFFNTATGGYAIQRSIRLNAPDSAYLSRTPASAGNRRTFTWAGWVKRGSVGSSYEILFSARAGTSSNRDYLTFQSDQLVLTCSNSSGTTTANIQTTSVYRDPGAWMHIVLSVDTTQSTASNRVKFYVNGTQVTTFSLANYPTQNTDLSYNDAQPHTIGQSAAGTAFGFNGLLADIHFCDGTAYDASAFGEFSATTGVWMPKQFAGSYGSQGWKLSFSDNSTAAALGTDSSGQGNTWSVNNLSVTAGAGNDSLVDVPTNGSEVDTGSGGQVRGNYCTWSPLDPVSNSTLANGNLDIINTGDGAERSGTIGVSSGKWYYEFIQTVNASAQPGINTRRDSGASATRLMYYVNGLKYNGATGSSYGATWTTNDVIGIALDLDSGTLTFYKNGVSQGVAFTGLSGTYYPWVRVDTSGSVCVANWGQRPWAYAAPSGYRAWCTANLPAPLVTKPSTVMDVKLYTGNGSTQTISGLGFSPDLVWMKVRSIGYNHTLIDSVRGATKTLSSSMTVQEYTEPTGPTAFTSDGWSMSGDVTYVGSVNANGQTYAGWCWDAGSSTVTNTSGSITGTVSVRANTTAGFSVVTYTGTGANATVGHGLGVAPRMVIIKRRDTTGNWAVYHAELANTQYMLLNSNAAVATGTTYWNSTSPTSTVFSVGTSADTNASGGTYVAYCFSAVSGYSAFGGYQAGTEPFVFLGFRPRYVMIKRTASGDGWAIFDTSRTTYNVATSRLEADTSAAEGGTDGVDLLSNGFKIKTTWGGMGGSSGSGLMVYAAFAESPFQYARAR